MAKIIIVEDDFNLANTYKARLTEEGYDVKIVGDKEAVNSILQEKPNLVLLDILMPDVSGLAILRELRDNPEFETLPVLVLTNDEKASDMEQAIKIGVDGYILKAETDLDSLVKRVGEFLASRESKGGDLNA
jgi:DNA-binding response OmpR family regulator